MIQDIKKCCHCCKTCFPDSLINQECEICTRLGRKCQFGHGRGNNSTHKIIKKQLGISGKSQIKTFARNNDVVRLQSSIPIINNKQPRIFPIRPISSSIKGPIKHTLGPALPFELSRPLISTPQKTFFPTPESVTVPIKHTKKMTSSQILIQPVYYDYEIKIPIQKLDSNPPKTARRFFQENRNGQSIKTNKTHDTMLNSKIISEFNIEESRKIRRQPMNPRQLIRMISRNQLR